MKLPILVSVVAALCAPVTGQYYQQDRYGYAEAPREGNKYVQILGNAILVAGARQSVLTCMLCCYQVLGSHEGWPLQCGRKLWNGPGILSVAAGQDQEGT